MKIWPKNKNSKITENNDIQSAKLKKKLLFAYFVSRREKHLKTHYQKIIKKIKTHTKQQ